MENGKRVCRELKAVRQKIADANGIEYTPNVCNHKGDCPGSCPACEEEVRYLEQQLSLRRSLGKVVVLAGLGLSVAACFSSCSVKGIVPDRNIEISPADNHVLQGDVVKSTIEPVDSTCTTKK